MADIAVIAKMIASNFEAIPNNAELTYCVSHHPSFQCGTVGDLLSLIGKLERPHEIVPPEPIEGEDVLTEEMAARLDLVADRSGRDRDPGD